MPPSTPEAPTVKELKERTYATFHRSGVEVDLDAFFRSESGQRAVKEIVQGVRFYNPPPQCGLHPMARDCKVKRRGD